MSQSNGMLWSYPVHDSHLNGNSNKLPNHLNVGNMPNNHNIAVQNNYNHGGPLNMINGIPNGMPPGPPQMIPHQDRSVNSNNDEGSSAEENEEGTDAGGNGEILHCMFPGCLKEFSSRWSLTRHTRTHTGERPFRCSVCAKEFVQKCSLKRHEQTHSQEKQWVCDFPSCGKRFKLKEYLDVHKRTHVKVDHDPVPADDDDPVVQDAADAAGALIDQLRQRLVRTSVRHHEQLFAHQQKEQRLMQELKECSALLEEAVLLLQRTNPDVPPHLINASLRFSSKTKNGFEDGAI